MEYLNVFFFNSAKKLRALVAVVQSIVRRSPCRVSVSNVSGRQNPKSAEEKKVVEIEKFAFYYIFSAKLHIAVVPSKNTS